VFVVEEGDKAVAAGHLRVINVSEVSNEMKFRGNKEEEFEELLAAGEDSDNAMRLSDFMERSGYEAVMVKEAEVLKEELGDEQVALYTDNEGKMILLIEREKAVELEKKGIVESIIPSSDRNIKLIEEKLNNLNNAELVEAGKKLIEKAIDGYIVSEDSTLTVKALLLRFNTLEEMIAYMGIEGEATESSVGRGYMNKLGEILRYEQEGGINAQERDEQIELARTLMGIVIASIKDGKSIGELVEKGDDVALKALVDKLDKDNKAVNRYIISKAMIASIKVTKGGIGIGDAEDFVIDISKLKAALETKGAIVILESIKDTDLGAVIAQGRRGKKNYPIMLSDIRSARAVAAAA
jgi:hypothetical protein